MSVPGRVARATEALASVDTHPDRALALASAALDGAHPTLDAEAVSMAKRALGLVARSRGDLVGARGYVEEAVDHAATSGLAVRVAEARNSLVRVLAELGDLRAALREADLALGALRGAAAARLGAQRALVLHRLGRDAEALAGYRKALGGFRRSGDREGQARVLTNRGVLHAYRGDYHAAESDLRGAERLHGLLDQELDAAAVRHNLGFVAFRRGDVPAALRWFDLAESEFRAHGVTRPTARLDHCAALLAVRLVAEARHSAATAVVEMEAAGAAADLAEARLLLSQAALLDGDPAEASTQATQARQAFASQHRAGWAALARYAALRAAWASGTSAGDLGEEAVVTADELVASGWVIPALDARLIAGRIALDAGRTEEATVHLRTASVARFRGPADLRAQAWHAEALLRHSRGETSAAESALRAGVRVLARNRATLGATELRVHATARVAELGRLGTRLALESGKARKVLRWAERLRSGVAGGARPPRPPADATLAEHLVELRHVVSQLEQAGFAGEDPGRLLRRQAALEAQIRRRTRHAEGTVAGGDDARPLSMTALAEGLGDRVLVELVASDGELGAVTLVDGRARLHRLASETDVGTATETLRFALGRLARNSTSPSATQEAAATLALEASARLDHLVFDPVRRRIADRPLVLVPTGSLHAVPWSTLASCRGRAVAVSPSATGWLRATDVDRSGAPMPDVRPRRATAGPVLVAGPGLAQAGPEIADLAEVHHPASVLRGTHATTAAFLGAANGADLVHVAAHGRFRADNPLLSSLRLADGPLTVYDLEGLDQPPRQLVLSACEAGLSAAHPGDELMGLVASLLALGSRTLVASVTTVSDTATRSLMVDLHGRLVAGAEPAEALAQAQAGVLDDGPGALAAAGFVCFGAG